MHSLIFLAYLDQCSMWGIVSTLHLSSASVCFSHVKVFPRINGANETKLGRNVTLVRQLTITYGQLMSSLLIFKYNMSHGTMKYTLQAHVYYYVFMAWLLHYLYSLHPDFYTLENIIIPRSPKGERSILFYLCPSKIFFVAFFSVTVDGRNLIFGHKHHIGIPYCGWRFWTHQIPTSCLPT